MLDGSGAVLRTVLTDDVCERFGFFDARGDKQRSTCLKALRDLEKKGHFVLPTASAAEGRTHTPRRLAEAVPAAKDVPATAGAVQGLRVVIVEEEHQLRLWNELMIREHPRAGGPMVGCQIRYLIGSDHGWLGGVGFGASALQLRDRDRWIGWDVQTRRAQLLEQASGLQYTRWRYLSPELGRWTQTDPISFLGGVNLFEYGTNNPLTKTDPSGLSPYSEYDDCKITCVDALLACLGVTTISLVTVGKKCGERSHPWTTPALGTGCLVLHAVCQVTCKMELDEKCKLSSCTDFLHMGPW